MYESKQKIIDHWHVQFSGSEESNYHWLYAYMKFDMKCQIRAMFYLIGFYIVWLIIEGVFWSGWGQGDVIAVGAVVLYFWFAMAIDFFLRRSRWFVVSIVAVTGFVLSLEFVYPFRLGSIFYWCEVFLYIAFWIYLSLASLIVARRLSSG